MRSAALVFVAALTQGCAVSTPATGVPAPTRPPFEVTPKQAQGDPDKLHFLMRRPGIDRPESGPLGLVVIIPGGPGDESLRSFTENLYRYGVPPNYLGVWLHSKKWTPEQRIVWPTRTLSVASMRFSTADFVNDVISDVGQSHAIDAKRIFVVGWSSGGPASYDALLTSKAVRGVVVAASVFRSTHFPSLQAAAGRGVYIIHSREDSLAAYSMAEEALDRFLAVGARAALSTYSGPHGAWIGTAFAPVREGIRWLELGNQ